jgi:hypothetical protein
LVSMLANERPEQPYTEHQEQNTSQHERNLAGPI